ncbi:2-hydroxyacid dehydrogenase [Pseudomonas sp. DSP3-2-2]|uniref:2-hydroxyacid dehydrogenase n=1 Tax=unclassified Pseudomonas TaxID=196821 RepID=UPI003CEFFE66
MYFLYNSYAERAERWSRLLTAELPNLRFIQSLDDVDPADVTYILTWDPIADLEKYTSLRIVFSAGAGVDQFDVSSFPEGVALVRMVEDSIAQSMAEYVVFAVLALHRDMIDYRNDQLTESWKPRDIQAAARRRVGVMGIGHLGRTCLAKLQSFDFQLLGWNRSMKAIDGVDIYVGREEFQEFLEQCDVLVNLLPLTEQTREILNEDLFRQLPLGAGVINVGRGGHLNEADLLAALDSGQVGGAVLDVFQEEPLLLCNRLWKHPRVWVTPHIASTMQIEGGAAVVVDSILRDRSGQPLLHTVNRGFGY